jgi:hypothetical protein
MKRMGELYLLASTVEMSLFSLICSSPQLCCLVVVLAVVVEVELCRLRHQLC